MVEMMVDKKVVWKVEMMVAYSVEKMVVLMVS
jgi:hypothetical protein